MFLKPIHFSVRTGDVYRRAECGLQPSPKSVVYLRFRAYLNAMRLILPEMRHAFVSLGRHLAGV